MCLFDIKYFWNGSYFIAISLLNIYVIERLEIISRGSSPINKLFEIDIEILNFGYLQYNLKLNWVGFIYTPAFVKIFDRITKKHIWNSLTF